MEQVSDYSHLSAKQFAEQIIARLHATFGVDLKAIFEDPGLSTGQKARRGRAALVEAVLTEADRSASHADFAPPPDFDEDTFLEQVLSEDVDIEPNLALTEADARYLMGLTGQEVKTYLFNLTKRFENMAQAKTPGVLAIEMVAGGLISVGIPAAWGTIKALRAGSALLAAVRTGIMSVGMKTAIVAVAVILVALLLYLFLENPKKILGMVINGTEDSFIVKDWKKGADGNKDGDLFMAHGEMADFMEDNEEGLQSPKVQIRGMVNFGEGDSDNVMFGGIYFADRKFGLRGSEGVMILTSTASDLRFAHMFAVPYFNDNGTNMKLITQGVNDIEVLYRELYDARKVSADVSEGGHRLRANVNDARGGVVGCIASITDSAT